VLAALAGAEVLADRRRTPRMASRTAKAWQAADLGFSLPVGGVERFGARAATARPPRSSTVKHRKSRRPVAAGSRGAVTWPDKWIGEGAEHGKETVMILAFPLALIGAAFLTWVTLAAR
jgi:hypothetical protein